ncbi:MAG: NFACT RNA binding domain-containing protein [Clostridium sp.]|uniref:Rqc2 family fibronectin-binding protein n=1 Tax=Clostridium sp. TaxID=1506 RepID=UPI001ECCFBB6|nr:NFACT RNA binding domain-containing protein [Clostridium sp.]MBS5885399.1 NFACT family protein [Clostridium sp.]MDU7149738.1 NFACT RNA binding domain-containing protein [Clostridium sp.]MDU7240717.1 NFACT RNA binding domain-containing protein [Clostridium sp.]
MALDGIYLYSLVYDLKKSILNCKIDKINQPEKDEVILTLRKDRKNIKLLISASSKFPRIHLTNISKPNPLQAPMFTMVMRKYLIGGRITDITQLNGDRILQLHIESTDELGFDSKYILIVEIMGRHSNITLVRERDNKVMECIKHISADINTFRVLYPGVNYVYPPNSNKLNPFNFSINDFNSYLNNNDISIDEGIFSRIFTGISKSLSISIYENLLQDNNTINRENIFNFFKNFMKNLENSFNFKIYRNNEVFKDFHCIKLSNLESIYSSISFKNPSELLDEFFTVKDKQDRLLNRSTDLQRLISTNIDRCNNKTKKLKNILKECEEKEKYKINGDLLTSYIYMLKKGLKEISLLNFYTDEEEYITITLDENKTPSENIQYLYKKYNKLKKSEESALEQLKKNEEELQYLNSVMTNILNCESYIEIDDIKKELIETGYLKFKNTNKNNKKDKSSKPIHLLSSDGIDIYIGKNNIQNDYLTLKFANKNHMWLHTKNIPGSHVILCSDNPSDIALEEAGILAAYYSKAKNSTKVPVDYTKVKNLKKPNGSKPGMVIYHTNHTLYTEPSLYNNLKIENNKIIK